MKYPFIVGERVYLRGLQQEDLDTGYFQWFNDEEVTRYMYHGVTPNSRARMLEFFESVQRGQDDVVFAIVIKDGDRHVGNTGLHGIDWVNRRAEFGIIIGEKDVWNEGYGTEATRLILDYGFGRLNLHRIYLGVHAEHRAAIAAYERAGFKQEGRLRDEYLRNGHYSDRVMMGALESDFERPEPTADGNPVPETAAR